MYSCKFCKRITESDRGNKKHQTFCKLNPERKIHYNIYSKYKSMGLSKPIVKQPIERKGVLHTDETKRKISNSRKIAFLNGTACGKNKIKFYLNNPDIKTYLYLVKFESENLSFIKIGISETGCEKRFRGTDYKKYNKTIIFQKYLNAHFAATLERSILKRFKPNYRYSLNEKFNGKTELFTTETQNLIVSYIEEKIEGYAGAWKDSNLNLQEFDSPIARIKSKRKKTTRNKEYLLKMKEKNERILPELEKINFSSWGSLKLASVIIGITPQKTKSYIKRHFPQLLN